MVKINIGGKTFKAIVFEVIKDPSWDDRARMEIHTAMSYKEAMETFTSDAPWNLEYQDPAYSNDAGEMVTPEPTVRDCSEFCVSGPITDNRDGTVSVKMGKKTDGEMLEELKEAINRGV